MEMEISNLKTEVAVINEKLDNQSKKIDMVISMIEKHTTEEEDRYKEIMDKKADVWVERVLIGAGSVIGVALLGSLLSLILIQ